MDEEPSNFVREHTLDRLINILQSNERSAKKRAFLEIKNTIKSTPDYELKDLYDKLSHILRICLKDRTESCREEALLNTYEFIKRLEPDKSHLTTLIPAIHSRICQEEDYEYSEEIRNLHVKLIALLIDKYEGDIAPFTSDIVDILAKLVADDAPHVKKSACACLIKCANTSPYEYFKNTKKCIKPLIGNLKHQHWRVRVATIEAIELTMLKADNKCLPDLMNPLSRCLLDDSPFVRLAIAKLTGHWLLKLLDRYSFLPNLVPLILTCLTDECEEVSQEAQKFWPKAGDQYVRENENNYKNRMDYEPLELEHYPPGVKRPSLGCRILVERQVDKFILTIGKELADWVALVKLKASQLLSQITLHAEHNITMHLAKIIGPMSRAAMDKESPEVVKYVRLAAYYMGFFVEPKVYCDLIVEYMKEANYGEREVIASILCGSKKANVKDYLPKIASLLGGTTFKSRDHVALLEVISAILETCEEDSLDIGDQIFSALVAVIGLTQVPTISHKATDLLQKLVDFSGGDRRKAYDKYCKCLLASLKQTLWTVHCHEQFIFYALVTHTGEVIADNLMDILEIIKDSLSEKSDPEVKLKIYMAINELIKGHETTLPNDKERNTFSKVMLEDILPLHLKWYPGRSAEAIRTVCSTSLYLIISTFSLDFSLPSTIVPLLQGLTEDPSEKTRVLGLLCLIALSNNYDVHEEETFVKIMANIMKRLDDSDRKVRELAVKCIKKLYEAHIGQEERNHIHRGVLEFAYATLLIHLDDSERQFREKVFDCLESIVGIEPEMLREKLLEQNFRDKEIFGRLKAIVEDKLKTFRPEDKKPSQSEKNLELSDILGPSPLKLIEQSPTVEKETKTAENMKVEEEKEEDFMKNWEKNKESMLDEFQQRIHDSIKKDFEHLLGNVKKEEKCISNKTDEQSPTIEKETKTAESDQFEEVEKDKTVRSEVSKLDTQGNLEEHDNQKQIGPEGDS